MTYTLVTGFDDNVRTNVQQYKKMGFLSNKIWVRIFLGHPDNIMFIGIAQICSLATACIGQPLLTFCSHTEQSWIFALIVAILKITYIVLL